nr:immunoglobulin light chain junction region [Macaca mulatta]MOX86172.1 immunoglobulin light chain junction region [Macaca mulatta]MOX88114.1 immunoglobulin light chain junction region [Macaca mulatta]MOX88890.1 immunoglobulin light chain junction region [Macaca mulatta]MOX89297.1 immunoglobulin light chain junction region [Macaca mulatta]
CQKYNTPPLTF